MTNDIRHQIGHRFLCDIGQRLIETPDTTRRTLVFGDLNPNDSVQARNLQGLANVNLVEVENCGHQTPAVLLERGRLLQIIREATSGGLV